MGGEGTISADAIAGMGSVNCSTRILGISRSDMSSINIGSGPTRVDIAGVPSVTVSNATHLKDLTVRKGVSSLSVYDCPALKTFDAEEAESLTAFNVSNLPAITNLTVGYTPKLKSVMPTMFVNMLQDGHSGLGYPIRYDYRAKTVDPEESPGEGWKMLKKYTGSWVDGEGQVHNDFYASLWYYDRGYGFYFSGEPTRGYHGTTEPPYMDWLWD